MEAPAAVVALDRHYIGHAVAHEGVAHAALEIEPLDARDLGPQPAIDRPADHARRLIELVEQSGTRNMDIDAVGIVYVAARHVLGIDRKNCVIATRTSLEEGRRPYLDQIAGSGMIGAISICAVCARGRVAQELHAVERKQHRHRACRDIGKKLAGCLVEALDRTRSGLLIEQVSGLVPVHRRTHDVGRAHLLSSRCCDANSQDQRGKTADAQRRSPEIM